MGHFARIVPCLCSVSFIKPSGQVEKLSVKPYAYMYMYLYPTPRIGVDITGYDSERVQVKPWRYNELSQKNRFQSVRITALCLYNIQRENLVFKKSLRIRITKLKPSWVKPIALIWGALKKHVL